MQEQEREVLAAEVLELGEQLFSLALEAQDDTEGEERQEQEPQIFPRAEIEAASVEFFTVLRLLLGVAEG